MPSKTDAPPLKLGLSEKGDARGRHLRLFVDRSMSYDIDEVLLSEVLRGADPVREWDAPNFRFIYRFHLRYLELLLLAFPDMQLSPGIDSWMTKKARDDYEALPVPDITIPGFYDYLAEAPADAYPWQKQGIERIERELIERGWSFALNDDLGLGKTVQALGVIIRNRLFPAVIVVPNSGKWSTERIRNRFFDDDFTMQIVDGTRAEREAQIDAYADITVINFETMRVKRTYNKSSREWDIEYGHPQLFFTPNGDRRVYEIAVIDEHHRIKTPGAQATNGFFELQAQKWLMMSGTPILNRPEEIWTCLHKIDPERFPSMYAFEMEFCIKHGSRVTGYKVEPMRWLRKYLAKHSMRRRTDVVIRDRPPVIYNIIDIDLTTEQRELYNQIKEEFLLQLEDGTEKHVVNALAQITRLKQACLTPELYGGSKHSAKITQLKSDVAELVAAGQKAIVFSQWSRATRIFQRELAQYNPAYVDGTVKGKNRGAQEDKFNYDDDCHLYIGTIGANREAISLPAATYVIMPDKDWTPMANQQAVGRSAAGGLRGIHLPPDMKVNVIEYHARDTVEQRIEQILARKQATFNAMFERDGGVRWKKMSVRMLRDLL